METVFNVERWRNWANGSYSLFYTLPDNGRVGVVTNDSSEDILVFKKDRNSDKVNVESNKIQEIRLQPVVDIVFIINERNFDEVLNDDAFKRLSELLKEGLISIFSLMPLNELNQKDYTLFLSSLGLSSSECVLCN